MRIIGLAFLVFCLLALSNGQNRSGGREKLRNLIAAARSGNVEARNTLRNLRSRLKSRRQNEVTRQAAATPAPPSIAKDPIPFSTAPQHSEPSIQPVEVVEAQPVRNIIQSRRPRVRTFTPDIPQDSFLEPHRALNRGLEVDTRSEANAFIRVTNQTRTPPIQTIKRYSYFDEEGNYIFGYEAADGSFKEEKRGRDCIVHGKYGYVDPDGVKREYNYVSGNRCDPDAPVEHDVQGNEIPLPKNDQFLVQTEEKQLDPEALSQLQFNRRRKPVDQQSFQPQQQIQPQVNQRFQSRRRQKSRPESSRRGNSITLNENNFNNIPQSSFDSRRPVQTFTTQTESPIRISTFRPVQPFTQQAPSFPPFRSTQTLRSTSEVFRPTPRPFRPEPQTFRPQPQTFRPPQTFIPEPQTFRTESRPQSFVQQSFRPLDNRFDFDEEFKNIFSNVPQRQSSQSFTQRTFVTVPPPTTIATTSRPRTEAPETKPVVFPPTTSKTPGFGRQLVFDSASGGFKSVPLSNSIQSSSFFEPPTTQRTTFFQSQTPSVSRPQSNPFRPPQTSFLQSSSGGGKPLPLSGFNPLPRVPLGSLSIKSHGSTRADDFDRFFSHFNIQ